MVQQVDSYDVYRPVESSVEAVAGPKLSVAEPTVLVAELTVSVAEPTGLIEDPLVVERMTVCGSMWKKSADLFVGE